MSFLLTEFTVLLIIVFLLLILSMVWPPDSPWAPWWQMPDDVIKKMCEMAKLSKKDVVYDLGCGTGKAIIFAAKIYGAKVVGIEIDPIRFWIACFNVWKTNNSTLTLALSHKERENMEISIYRKNFFDVSLSPATIIFVYLVPNALKRLTPKFLKELRPGTKFLSFIYPMPQGLFKGRLKLKEYNKKMKIYYYTLLS